MLRVPDRQLGIRVPVLTAAGAHTRCLRNTVAEAAVAKLRSAESIKSTDGLARSTGCFTFREGRYRTPRAKPFLTRAEAGICHLPLSITALLALFAL